VDIPRSIIGLFTGFLCIAGLALAQPAAANRMISGVTAHLHVADVQVREGEDATFVLYLSSPLDFDILYRYQTRDGTAKAGRDYVAENGDIVIPAGTRFMSLPIKTLKDDVIDKNHFQLLLSNPKTKGYGTVWGAYVWTDWWLVEGLPLEVTVTATIANALGESFQQSEPENTKYRQYTRGRGSGGRDNRGGYNR